MGPLTKGKRMEKMAGISRDQKKQQLDHFMGGIDLSNVLNAMVEAI